MACKQSTVMDTGAPTKPENGRQTGATANEVFLTFYTSISDPFTAIDILIEGSGENNARVSKKIRIKAGDLDQSKKMRDIGPGEYSFASDYFDQTGKLLRSANWCENDPIATAAISISNGDNRIDLSRACARDNTGNAENLNNAPGNNRPGGIQNQNGLGPNPSFGSNQGGGINSFPGGNGGGFGSGFPNIFGSIFGSGFGGSGGSGFGGSGGSGFGGSGGSGASGFPGGGGFGFGNGQTNTGPSGFFPPAPQNPPSSNTNNPSTPNSAINNNTNANDGGIRMIGDSLFTHGDNMRRSLVAASSLNITNHAVLGAWMRDIRSQYQNIRSLRPRVVIMDGGGNDVLGQREACSNSMTPQCKTTVDAAIDIAKDIWRTMAQDGVKSVVYMQVYYPEPGRWNPATYGYASPGSYTEAVDYAFTRLSSECKAQQQLQCIIVDPRPAIQGMSGYTDDGVHPSAAASTKIAAAIWQAMQQANIR